HANEMHDTFLLGGDALPAAQELDDDKEQAPAVQSRDREQVEQPEGDRDQDGELDQDRPLGARRGVEQLAGQLAHTDRAGELIETDIAGERLAERLDRPGDDLPELAPAGLDPFGGRNLFKMDGAYRHDAGRDKAGLRDRFDADGRERTRGIGQLRHGEGGGALDNLGARIAGIGDLDLFAACRRQRFEEFAAGGDRLAVDGRDLVAL